MALAQILYPPARCLLQPDRLLQRVCNGAAASLRQMSTDVGTTSRTALGSTPETDQQAPYTTDFVTNLQQGFQSSPREAADMLAASLTPAQRAVLSASLWKPKNEVDDGHADILFDAADMDGDKDRLTRNEFRYALDMHRAMEGRRETNVPPNWSALRMIFLASAIPFVGFGFLDNFIMLVAGEEIDMMFGAKLGLSTLASAGLGNLVADVIGVGAANWIEQGVKKLPFLRDFRLTKAQSVMRVTRVTKALGATLGVMVGCMLGMVPLYASGTFFVPKP